MKEEEKLKRSVEVHVVNVNYDSGDETLLWVRIARVFNSRSRKSEYQDIRNMLNTGVT